MKEKGLFKVLAFILFIIAGTTTKAQPQWTGSTLTEGSFYLYNLGAQKFLTGSNSWGTQASLGDAHTALLIKLTRSPEGLYTISTDNMYTGRYLGDNGYVDNGTAWPLTFKENTPGSNIYTIQNGADCLGYDGSSTVLNLKLQDPMSANAQWYLIEENLRNTTLANYLKANASASNPLDATPFIFNPDMTKNGKAWASTTSVKMGSGGVNSQNEATKWVGELYQGWGNTTAFDMYQEIKNLPNGKYKLSLTGFFRDGSPEEAASRRQSQTEELSSYCYANEQSVAIKSIFEGAGKNGTVGINTALGYIPNDLDQAARYFEAVSDGSYDNSLEVIVTDNSLRIGIRNNTTDRSKKWTTFDEFRLTYYGVDLTALNETLQTALEKANAKEPNKPTAGIYKALSTAITTAENVQQTEASLTIAIAQLNDALQLIEAATPVVSSANELIGICQNIADNSTAKAEDQNTFKAAIQTAQTSLATEASIEGINNLVTTLENERQAYVQQAYPINSIAFDMTFLIQNANVNGTDGWTNGRTASGQQYTDAPDNVYLDNWNANLDMFQNLNLPAGAYKLTAATRANAEVTIGYIYLNDTRADIERKGNTENTLGNGWAWTTTAEALVQSNAKIGFYSECVNGKWAGADNFKLELLRELTAEEKANAAKAELTNKLEEARKIDCKTNVGTETFQIPQVLADNLSKQIQNAENIQGTSTDATTIENATLQLQTAVDKFKNHTLNKPSENDRFHVIMHSNGGSIDNKAWTYIYTESKKEDGYYDLKWEHEANANYAQTLTFTATTEKNQYTLSFTDENGLTRYISTQALAGYMDGNATSNRNERIRVTTDASKALTVNISVTDKSGIWKLNNPKHGQNIGATNNNDSGVFTSNSCSDLQIVKAAPADVSFTMTPAQWGTIILPFNAEIPTGMKAYTCDALGNATNGHAPLILTETNGQLKANTPYIMFGQQGTHHFSGYGLATKDSYTAGLLTGIFTPQVAIVGTYVLQDQKDWGVNFYKVTDVTPEIAAYRAYMNAPASMAGANISVFQLTGGTTSVSGITAETPFVDVYNLNGTIIRKGVKANKALNGLPKGIYIVNGTKKAVK